MTDPVSIALASFTAIKKGFQIGRDLESMMGDLSRWMGALSDLEQQEKEAQATRPYSRSCLAARLSSSRRLRLSANARRARAQRDELKQWISLTLGQSAWEELIRMEGQIRKQRQETLYRQRERRRKFVEVLAWTIMIGAGSAVLVAFVLLLKAHTAQANDWANDLTTCRLVKCMKLDKTQEVCVYRGAHNTQETMFYKRGEWKPREYLCQWQVDQPPPPNVYEVLKAIKESQ